MTDQIEGRPLRLLVVDDHEVVRQGLVSLLERREHFQVVAEAGTAAEASRWLASSNRTWSSWTSVCRTAPGSKPARDSGRVSHDPRRDPDKLSGRRSRPLGDHRRRVGLPPQANSKPRPRQRPRVRRPRRVPAGSGRDREGPGPCPPHRHRHVHRQLAQLTQQEQKILLLVAEGKTNKEIARRSSSPTRRSRTTSARSFRSSIWNAALRLPPS